MMSNPAHKYPLTISQIERQLDLLRFSHAYVRSAMELRCGRIYLTLFQSPRFPFPHLAARVSMHRLLSRKRIAAIKSFLLLIDI